MNEIELPGQAADPDPAADQTADNQQGDQQNAESPFSRLFSTHEPDRTPDQLQREYALPKGRALVLYGVLQMAETGGMPAIGNIALGVLLESRDRDSGGSDTDDETDHEGPAAGAPGSPAEVANA